MYLPYLLFLNRNVSYYLTPENWGFPGGTSGKESTCNAGDIRGVGSVSGLFPTGGTGCSPGGGHHNPLQYSFLENPMDRGAWRATAHRVTKSWT